MRKVIGRGTGRQSRGGVNSAMGEPVDSGVTEHADRGIEQDLAAVAMLRRRLAQDAVLPEAAVTAADLTRFGELFSDLADPEIMDQAWR